MGLVKSLESEIDIKFAAGKQLPHIGNNRELWEYVKAFFVDYHLVMAYVYSKLSSARIRIATAKKENL